MTAGEPGPAPSWSTSLVADEPGPARVGFVVSKAVGNAVVRNRVQRRLRHLAREHLASLPGSAVLVIRALPALGGGVVRGTRGRPEPLSGAGERVKYPLIWFLKAYRLLISPLYGQVCRYHPSCSAYALEAVHGARQHPWQLAGRPAPAALPPVGGRRL